jgi:RNase P protein component
VFTKFSKELKEDEKIVVAALKACKNSSDAKNVIESCDKKVPKKALTFALKKFGKDFITSYYLWFFSSSNSDFKKDQDVIVVALEACGDKSDAVKVMEKYEGEKTEKVIQAYLKRNPDFFEQLSEEEKDKASFVVAALEGCKIADKNPLEAAKKVIASTSLKIENNEEILKSYLTFDPEVFLTLKSTQKKDTEIVVIALKGCLTEETTQKVMENVDFSLKEDRAIVLEIVKTNPVTYKFLSEDIRDNKELALEAMRSTENCEIGSCMNIVFDSIPLHLRDNAEKIEDFFKISRFIYCILDESLQADEKVVLSLIENLKKMGFMTWSLFPDSIKTNTAIKDRIKEKFPTFSFNSVLPDFSGFSL